MKDKPVQRVVFNAITRHAVLDAMQHPRKIDADLVDAYLARRALDYLVGFTLSPMLWRKLPGARSAGRVQSVALRLICDRELEIESVQGAGILDDRGRCSRPVAATASPPASRHRRQEARQVRHPQRGVGPRDRGRARRCVLASPPSNASRSSATRLRRSARPRCSRKPRASSASPPRARCSSPSASMRASAARPSVSSPICVPTA